MFYLLYFAFLLPTLETLTPPTNPSHNEAPPIPPTSPSHNKAPPIPPLQQDVNGISGNEA